jgi:hypothetical protein
MEPNIDTGEHVPPIPRLCRYLSERSPQPMVAVDGTTHIAEDCIGSAPDDVDLPREGDGHFRYNSLNETAGETRLWELVAAAGDVTPWRFARGGLSDGDSAGPHDETSLRLGTVRRAFFAATDVEIHRCAAGAKPAGASWQEERLGSHQRLQHQDVSQPGPVNGMPEVREALCGRRRSMIFMCPCWQAGQRSQGALSATASGI